jgi:hypothetical protein
MIPNELGFCTWLKSIDSKYSPGANWLTTGQLKEASVIGVAGLAATFLTIAVLGIGPCAKALLQSLSSDTAVTGPPAISERRVKIERVKDCIDVILRATVTLAEIHGVVRSGAARLLSL